MDHTAPFRRLAFTAAGASAGLVVFGSIVRITQSGMGCGDDWPLCNGELIPTFTLPVAIEYGHRLYAAVVIALFATLTTVAWKHHRTRLDLVQPAIVGLALIVFQALLGAITVWLELPPFTVIVHFINALIATAVILTAGLRARPDAGHATPSSRLSVLALTTMGLGFLAVLLGAWVANVDAGAACVGFPLCNGSLVPGGGFPVHLHWTHRLVAYLFVVLVGLGMARALWLRAGDTRLHLAYWGLAAATTGQVLIAAIMIIRVLPPVWRALHVAFGTLVWLALVTAMFWERRPPAAGRVVDVNR